MPKISGKAKRLRVYIGEADHYKGQPLYHYIIMRAKELDIAGATVLRGLEGYGANSRVHTARLIDLSSDLPIVIEIVDSEEYLTKLLPILDEVVTEGLVTIDDVEIIKYSHKTLR